MNRLVVGSAARRYGKRHNVWPVLVHSDGDGNYQCMSEAEHAEHIDLCIRIDCAPLPIVATIGKVTAVWHSTVTV